MNKTQNISGNLTARETVFLFTLNRRDRSPELPVSAPPEFRAPAEQDLLREHADKAALHDGFSLVHADSCRITAVQKLNRNGRFLYWSLELNGPKNRNDLSLLRECPDFIRSYLYFRFDAGNSVDRPGPNGTRLEQQRRTLLTGLESCFNELRATLQPNSRPQHEECLIKGEGILRELFKLQYVERLNETDSNFDVIITRTGKTASPGPETVFQSTGTRTAEKHRKSNSSSVVPLHPGMESIDNARRYSRTQGFPRFSVIAVTVLLVCISVFSFWKFLSRTDRDALFEPETSETDNQTGEILSMLNQAITSRTPLDPAAAVSQPPALSSNLEISTPPGNPVSSTGADNLSPSEVDPAAFRLLQAGNPSGAGARWWNSMKSVAGGVYTVQLELDCVEETILNTHQALSGTPELFVLPTPAGSRSCHRVCLGLFYDRPSAEASIADLPGKFKSIEYPPQIHRLRDLVR